MNRMKPTLIAATLILIWAPPRVFAGHTDCRIVIQSEIEVTSRNLSVADLLAPGSCPELANAAAEIPLGQAPLSGSVRVLDREQVRALLQPMLAGQESADDIAIPQRVVIRRAGLRASCREIADQALHRPHTPAVPQSGQDIAKDHRAQEVDCGAAGRISDQAPLEFTRSRWKPESKTWEISVRCLHGDDCVPFLMRIREANSGPAARAPGSSSARAVVHAPEAQPTIRRGQQVTLLWDEGGIHLTTRAVSLDRGSAGDQVRARLSYSGHVVRATVVSAGVLRTPS